MQKKIEQYATVKSSSMGRSATAERMQALADLGQKASNVAFGIAAKNRQKQGAIEGAQAGQKAAESGEMPQQKDGVFPTVYGEAFENAQQSAYLASIDRNAIERLSELKNEFSHDVDGFKASSKGYLAGLLKNAPEEYRPALAQSFNNYSSRGTIEVTENVLKQGRREATNELLGAIDVYGREASRASRNGDSEAVLDLIEKAKMSASALVENRHWTKDQADEEMRTLRNETTEQAYLQIVDDMPIEEAIRRVDEAEKDVFEGFSGDEHDALIARARARIQNRLAKNQQGRANAKKVFRDRMLALEVSIKTGEGEPDEMIQEATWLFKHGAYEPSKAASMIGTIHNDLKKRQKVWERIEDGDKSIVVDSDAVEKVYRKEFGDKSAADKVGFVRDVNMIPKSLKKEIANSLYSGSIQQAAEAAGMMESMSEIQTLEEPFPVQDRAYATKIMSLMDVYPEEEAIRIARQQTDPRDQDRIDFRKADIKENYKQRHWESGANDALDTSWLPFSGSVDAISMPEVSKDYKTAFEKHYIAGMDEDDAKNAAEQDLKRIYSEWNGRQMKHSPDKYYSINGDTDWVVSDLKESLTGAIAGAPEVKDFYFISDARTSKEAAMGKPSYLVRYKTDSGWDTLIGRYVPDVEKGKADAKEKNKSKVEAIREQSKFYSGNEEP